MVTAVDTNVLLDILIPGAPEMPSSLAALSNARAAGTLAISESVYAELAGRFPAHQEMDRFLASTGIRLEPTGTEALYAAGQAWVSYSRARPRGFLCSRCGESQRPSCQACGAALQSRQHLVADFLIGSHALYHAEQLLTRDRGAFAAYFPNLVLMQPT